MPSIWNHNKVAVTQDELVPKFFNKASTLRSALHRYESKPYGIKRLQKGGNGRQMLIDFDTLPKEVQEALGDPRLVGHLLERYYQIDAKAVDYYADWQYPNGNYILPETQEQYITNASVLKAAVLLESDRKNERINKGGSTRGIIPTICHDVATFNPTLKANFNTSHNLPKTLRHFKKVFKAFKDYGYEGIIKDPKGTRQQNARKLTGETMALLNNLFGTLSKKPTPTEVARDYQAFLNGQLDVVNNITGEVYNPSEFSLIKESTIRKYLATWESTTGTHTKRNGDRQKLMQRFDPYHSFDMPSLAGSLISVDDRQPPFEYEKGKRMWFYNGIDLASECFTVWVYGKTKEGIIHEFYKQMVRNYHDWGFNLPAEIEAESSLNSSFTETILKPGNMFEHVNIYANKARSKRIEAYYKPLRYQLEKNHEGWLARPFALSEPNQISNKSKQYVPYDVLTEQCLTDIMTWNNMEHSKIKGKTRWEVFCENQNPDLKPTNYKAILPHLGYKTKTSCNAGIMLMNSRKWLLGDKGEIYTGENLIRLMKQVEGQNIEIYWLDGNDGKVIKALVYIDGRYICEALPKPRYNKAKIEQTEEDLKARDIMTRYATTVESFRKTQKNQIEQVSTIDYRKKTLNEKFVMPGLKRHVTRTEEVQEVQTIEDDFESIPNHNVGQSWDAGFKI